MSNVIEFPYSGDSEDEPADVFEGTIFEARCRIAQALAERNGEVWKDVPRIERLGWIRRVTVTVDHQRA
jgi:hypothetical protein